eukprot:434822-Prymnesium_polylepis.1
MDARPQATPGTPRLRLERLLRPCGHPAPRCRDQGPKGERVLTIGRPLRHREVPEALIILAERGGC